MTTMIREIYEALKEAGPSEEKATVAASVLLAEFLHRGHTGDLDKKSDLREMVSTSSKAVYGSSKLASGKRSEACAERFRTWTNA